MAHIHALDSTDQYPTQAIHQQLPAVWQLLPGATAAELAAGTCAAAVCCASSLVDIYRRYCVSHRASPVQRPAWRSPSPVAYNLTTKQNVSISQPTLLISETSAFMCHRSLQHNSSALHLHSTHSHNEHDSPIRYPSSDLPVITFHPAQTKPNQCIASKLIVH